MAVDTLFLQLHKLSALVSEESLEQALTILWKTRKTGLGPPEKTQIKSLLALPSLAELDLVLACLRSLIRKCVHENCTGDDLMKLFPPDLSLDFRSNLILSLQKYQSQWKEELSKEPHSLPRSSVSYQVRTSALPSFPNLPFPDASSCFWSHEDDCIVHRNLNNRGASEPIITNASGSCLVPLSIQQDATPPENLGIIPRLKSMTWAMENLNSAPANKVPVIHLKLQDDTKYPLGEIEVKFQINKDTLEAMLRSMAYISEQLASITRNSSEPAEKKQRQ